MNRKTIARMIIPLMGFIFLFSASTTEAFLYHATRKAAARRIMQRGINPAKFKTKTRFGKGLYLSRDPATALAEKGRSRSVIRFKERASLKKKLWDLRRLSLKKLRRFLGRKYDLRGAVKKNIIGPKAAHRLGKLAGKKGKVIHFRSVRNGGTNIFIPEKVYRTRPRIVRPQKIIKK